MTTKLYFVTLYGRPVACFEDKVWAEKYRVSLVVDTHLSPNLHNLLRLEHVPRTELYEVRFDIQRQGFDLLSSGVCITRDSRDVHSLREDEDLPLF